MIYLDNASIVKPKKEVINTVIDILNNHWANASSVNYEFGLESKRIIEQTRKLIAEEINCEPEEIILCGSGSECNSLAIDGWLKANNKKNFITTVIEHSSILNNDKVYKVIKCDKYGLLHPDSFKEINNELVSVQYANNEVGSISDIKSIVDVLHKNNCIVHTDAVQAFGHIRIDVKKLGVDMLTATSQKIGGVCGAAFLFKKKDIKLSSIIYGSQEYNLRGSTYNVPAIAAFGTAISLLDYNKEIEIQKKRDYLLNLLLRIPGVTLNGSIRNRLSNNINICVHDIKIESQQLIAFMDLQGYCLSAGSACHTGDSVPSATLKAIGLSDYEAKHSIRITINDENTYNELDRFANDFRNCILKFTN